MKKALKELLIVGVLGLALGATSNELRNSYGLKWTFDYFPQTEQVVELDGNGDPVNGGNGSKDPFAGFTLITVDELVYVVGDPDRDEGAVLIVDVRAERPYSEGHLEGAIRCYHFEGEDCVDSLLEDALQAEQIVVYCNGGECDDSKVMYKLFLARGVREDAMRLFAGGWAAWVNAEMPGVKGAYPFGEDEAASTSENGAYMESSESWDETSDGVSTDDEGGEE
ncbi:MAG: rhodanese-like domain-containing protein [Planctomycetota bacterium]|jgi:rhodanese-related sulfurtransferase